MKHLFVALVSVLIGISVGWYFGYTRPVTKGYRELKEALHITDMPDNQFAEAGAQIRDHMLEFMERIKRSDDMTAALALGTFKRLEQGNLDAAKKLQLTFIGGYYRRYHSKGGDQKILANIDEAAQQYPDIAAELTKKQ
jgi:hypothetical protein